MALVKVVSEESIWCSYQHFISLNSIYHFNTIINSFENLLYLLYKPRRYTFSLDFFPDISTNMSKVLEKNNHNKKL